MMHPPALTSELLACTGVRHGFFGSKGGNSSGVFSTLNTGPGSGDDLNHVEENRLRCAKTLGVTNDRLLTVFQIHSEKVVHAPAPWEYSQTNEHAPQADAIVTAEKGLAVGALAADCMPWLFADPDARIVAAAHAGWRGALAGVLENTVAQMEQLGATRKNIRAALGPCLRQDNFEVGIELLEAFTAKYPQAARFFTAGANAQKRQLDLAGFGAWRLRESGLEQLDDVMVCTLGQTDTYFTYRGARRSGAESYGRNLSAIALV